MEPQKRFQSFLSSRSILVIADDAFIRQHLADQKVIQAADTAAGMRTLFERYCEISAVILDLQTPDCDGAAFLQTVRRNKLLSAVPIIVVSCAPNVDEESALLELGANDYIVMPLQKKVLVSRIHSLIRMQETVTTLNLLEKDDLTGLYSKQAFLHHAKIILDSDPDTDYDLMVTDIDKFKLINAIYGEEKADELLKSLAVYLNAHFGDEICARYGADRFSWIEKSKPENAAKLEKVLSDFAEVSPIPDVTIQCGVYAHVDRKVSIIRMCDNALFALKSIKTDCRHVVAYYDGPVSQRHLREQFYAAKFPEALKSDEFVVWYQPKYDPYSNAVVGAEALVRWKNSDGKFNLPGEFLSVFEANGMIGQLDEYVFRTVCRQQKEWKDAGIPPFPVSVNLSRNSISKKNLASVYAGIAKEYDIDPRFLPIEITETTVTDSIMIQEHAKELSRAGFPLHMDDFGSEHSSLHTLNVLDFEKALTQ